MVIVPLIVMVLLCILAFFAHALVFNLRVIGLAELLFVFAFPGAALWLAGWIVEGFAKNAP
jgi:hypothetical protein